MGSKRPSEVDFVIGLRIRSFREAAGLTQGDLGAFLGVTFQQVQKYENGRNRVGAGCLFQIAEILKVPVTRFYPAIEDETAHQMALKLRRIVLDKIVQSAELCSLTRSFARISNQTHRKSVLKLVQELSSQDSYLGE